MKKEIGNIYQTTFSNYAPPPPGENWLAIEKKMKSQKLHAKRLQYGAIAGGLIFCGAILLFIWQQTKPTKSPITPENSSPIEEMTPSPSENTETLIPYSAETEELITPDPVEIKTTENPPSPTTANVQEYDDEEINPANNTSTRNLREEITKIESIPSPASRTQSSHPIDIYPKNINRGIIVPKSEPLDSSENVLPPTEEQFVLQVPNAFTPSSHTNNFFRPAPNPNISNYEMTIYSRQGSVIFTSKNMSPGWDGTFEKGDAQPGVYIYLITFTDEVGKPHKQTGHIMLIR